MKNLVNSYFGTSDYVPEKVSYPKGDPFIQSCNDLTKFADVAYPVNEKTASRMNDIDAANLCTDPDLKNVLFKNLTPIPDNSGIDTSLMSDDEIADTVLPKNLQLGDVLEATHDVIDMSNSIDDTTPDVSSDVSVDTQSSVTQSE